MKKLIPLILCVIFIVAYIYHEINPSKDSFEPQGELSETPVFQETAPQESVPQISEPAYSANWIAGGACTDTVTWTLYSDGMLTVSGTGAIPDYEKNAGNQPWAGYWQSITALSVDAGITRIGDRAFQGFRNLERAVFAGDAVTVGQWAFQNCYALTYVDAPETMTLETGAFRSTPVEWELCSRPSQAYAASGFSAALHQVALTGNYREDVINIALSQLGYHEGDSEADYGGGNQNGTNDYTEYGRCLDSTGSAWCSEFASWCIRNAGVPASIVASSRAANVTTFTAGTSAVWYTWDVTASGGGSYMPRKGDLLLWSWDALMHGTEENLSHTSILWEVLQLENGNVLLRTIDGNSGNQVRVRDYEVNAADGTLVGRTGILCYIIAPDY